MPQLLELLQRLALTPIARSAFDRGCSPHFTSRRDLVTPPAMATDTPLGHPSQHAPVLKGAAKMAVSQVKSSDGGEMELMFAATFDRTKVRHEHHAAHTTLHAPPSPLAAHRQSPPLPLSYPPLPPLVTATATAAANTPHTCARTHTHTHTHNAQRVKVASAELV